ncbi:hypothetical protein L596_004875 [Steinernema carpocapsae]|uniref:Cyclic nucleotide-binding domain-containing protein n=1 Tax=Steinernema carpocapsae TaxID=34508 RepID=A0A4U8V1C5_STECR|nr:hypothetical protein L596_004875 [Steinernema carpocapsae]
MDHCGIKMDAFKKRFHEALLISPKHRTEEHLKIIFINLRQLDILRSLSDASLRAICPIVRYERHPEHSVLFRKGQVATCWYILLSGCVLMDNNMYLPCGCCYFYLRPLFLVRLPNAAESKEFRRPQVEKGSHKTGYYTFFLRCGRAAFVVSLMNQLHGSNKPSKIFGCFRFCRD